MGIASGDQSGTWAVAPPEKRLNVFTVTVEADVGGGECRRVIDAVAGHRNNAAFGAELLDDVGLAIWEMG